jgi:hypothetical protein
MDQATHARHLPEEERIHWMVARDPSQDHKLRYKGRNTETGQVIWTDTAPTEALRRTLEHQRVRGLD